MALVKYIGNDTRKFMKSSFRLIVPLCLVSAVLSAFAAPMLYQVTQKTRLQFEKSNPCPVQRTDEGACKDFTVVYIDPLCYGGKDIATNVKWLPLLDLKRDEQETKSLCSSGGGAGTGGRYTKTHAQTKHAAVHHTALATSTSSTCYTGPRGGRYRIVNGRKRYGC